MNWGTVPDICKLKSFEKIASFWEEGKVPMLPLNNLMIFFQKIVIILVAFKINYSARIWKQFEKRKYRKR